MCKRLNTKGKEMYYQTPGFRLNKRESEKNPRTNKTQRKKIKQPNASIQSISVMNAMCENARQTAGHGFRMGNVS